MNAGKEYDLTIISYPPISLVEKYLKTSESELNSSIKALLFPTDSLEVTQENSNTAKDLNIANGASSLRTTLLALGCVFTSAGANLGPAQASLRFPAMADPPVTSRLSEQFTIKEAERVRTRVNVHKFPDKIERVSNIKITTNSQLALPSSASTQPRGFRSILSKDTPLTVTKSPDGYSVTGNFGRFTQLKNGQKKVKDQRGSTLFPEQVDHLLPTYDRNALEISSKGNRSGDMSTAIIVRSWLNNKRTDRNSKCGAQSPSFSYADNQDLPDFLGNQVKESARRASKRTLTSEEKKDFAKLSLFMPPEQILERYSQATGLLQQVVQSDFIEGNAIRKSDGLLVLDTIKLQQRLKGRKTMKKCEPRNFGQLETDIIEELGIINQASLVLQSCPLHMKQDAGMTANLQMHGLTTKQAAIEEREGALNKYKHLYTKSEVDSLQKKISGSLRDVRFPENSENMRLEEIYQYMQRFQIDDMYGKL